MVTLEIILKSLRNNLSRDLLSDHWARLTPPNAPAVSGHCAIAAEALYHILGAEKAGFTPYVCKYHMRGATMVKGPGPEPLRDETHWWVRGPLNGMRGAGAVIDPTESQYNVPFPYGWGRGCGFQSPSRGPSRRAQILIDRVERECGAEQVAGVRAEMIAEFKALVPSPFRRGLG